MGSAISDCAYSSIKVAQNYDDLARRRRAHPHRSRRCRMTLPLFAQG